MSLTVVGSIAFDTVETTVARRERLVGGSATHFAIAASFFDEVRVVGPVGDDFGDEQTAVLTERGVNVEDIEHVAGGRTFFWEGRYERDMNQRETLTTELNVFEHFAPKLSQGSKDADVLFLANIHPDLQREVHGQCERARFVALDSMDLWIDIARQSLRQAIAGVDAVLLNDGEIKMLTGEPNLSRAAQALLEMGPSVVVAKQGEYGAALFTREGFFALPAFPLADVADPTGAGDTFAGGFVGYIAAHPDAEVDQPLLRRAMAYGTAMASFNVQEFGTDRVRRLSADEITDRVGELQRITTFEDRPLTLRD